MKSYVWKLKDIIMVGMLSVMFAVVYLGTVYLSLPLTTLLAPFGLAPLASELLYGIWFMAATFSAYIIRKPGVATITEMLAALIEVLMGSMYGPIVLLEGFIQGVGAEAGFMAFKYKKFNLTSLMIGSFGSAMLSFIWAIFYYGFYQLSGWLLLLMLITRIASALFFSGVVAKLLADKLAQTGVLKSYPIGENIQVDFDE